MFYVLKDHKLIYNSVKSQFSFFSHLPIFSHLHHCLLEIFPRRNIKFLLDMFAGNISMCFEKGVLVILGLGDVKCEYMC